MYDKDFDKRTKELKYLIGGIESEKKLKPKHSFLIR